MRARKTKEQDYIDILKDKRIDGVIFHHLSITQEQIQDLQSHNIQYVLIDNESVIGSVQNILTDNVLGAYMATRHLISLGHKEIGIIHNIQESSGKQGGIYEDTYQKNIWKQRMEGFLKAMGEAGLPVKDKYMFKIDQEVDNKVEIRNITMQRVLQGRKCAVRLLKKKERPTAIYAQNDPIAIGAINTFLENNLRVPEHISIIGHDGLEECEVLYPKMSTVEQPRYQMGYLAAQMLIQSIEKSSDQNNIVLAPRLIVRESTHKI